MKSHKRQFLEKYINRNYMTYPDEWYEKWEAELKEAILKDEDLFTKEDMILFSQAFYPHELDLFVKNKREMLKTK